MAAMPGPCAACGEALPHAVGFCPFCGAARRQAASEPAQPGPIADVRPVEPRPRPGPVPRPVPEPALQSKEPPEPAPNAAAAPAAPYPPRPFQPGSVPPVSPRPTILPMPPVQRRPARPRLPPRPPTAAQRRARALARRQLLLAAAILGGGALAWQLLTAGPHGDLVVTLPPSPVPGAASAADGVVLVDGVEAGTVGVPIRLGPGRHLVGLAAGGWTTPTVAIRLRAGETRRVPLHPVPHHAELSLDTVPPGALLELHPAQVAQAAQGGRRLGRAPADLALPPGDYRLVATLPGYRPLDQPLVLLPGERRVLSLALAPDPLRVLHLLAPPAGGWSAAVMLDPGDRFTLVFQNPIRVRAGGQVMLLDNASSDLGSLAGRSLAVAAVGDAPVPVDLLVRKPGPG